MKALRVLTGIFTCVCLVLVASAAQPQPAYCAEDDCDGDKLECTPTACCWIDTSDDDEICDCFWNDEEEEEH